MTDQHTPDLEALDAAIAPVREAWDDLVAGIRQAWKAAKPALNATQDDYALAPTPDNIAAAVIPARRALAACLDGDDGHAAEALDGLTAAQLYAIEGAGSGLAIIASRLRDNQAADQRR